MTHHPLTLLVILAFGCIVATLLVFFSVNADPPAGPTPPLTVGQSYLVKLVDDKKVCGTNWIPLKVLAFSERGDVIEVELPNTKDGLRWITLAAVCDAQKLRAEAPK